MPKQDPTLAVDSADQPDADPGNGQLQIHSERWSNAYVVSVSGALDVATAENFDEELQKARKTGAPRIILDLSSLRYIDSTGLLVLVRAEIASRKESIGLFLTRTAHQVERMLEMSGLRNQFRFLD